MSDQEARELKLYIDNDGDLYRRQTTSILKNLTTKKVRSQYKHDLAVKLFGYLVESGAKKYAKEFGTPGFPWNKMFDVPTRKLVAEALTRDFEGEFESGSYDNLLPKKYQAELSKKHLVPLRGHVPQHTRAHATKKLPMATHVKLHDPKVLRTASDRQVREFYTEEKRDAARARAEAARRGLAVHATRKAKTLEDYEAEGYNAHTWYLASCPYRQPKIRDAWQRGAWKWQQEQRVAKKPPSAHASAHATRASHATISARDIREFNGYLRNATDRQVEGIYEKESAAGRDEYAELAAAEASRRGIVLDDYSHARKKSRSQLDREIEHSLSRRGGR